MSLPCATTGAAKPAPILFFHNSPAGVRPAPEYTPLRCGPNSCGQSCACRTLIAAHTIISMSRSPILFLFATALFAQDFMPLFNGKDLNEWIVDTPDLWRVENGVIIGKSPGLKYNDFLRTRR